MPEMHDTMKRLYHAASILAQPIRGQSAVAAALGESPQTLNNWEARGVSKRGATKAQSKLGISSSWVTEAQSPVLISGISRIAEIETTEADSFRIDLIAAEADMGDGRINEDFPEVIRAVEFPSDYIRSVVGFLPPPGRLVLVTGRGDSMIPVIQPGDSVIVDTGVAKYDGDGLYLINLGNGQQIKRLVDHGEDAGIYAHSDNKAYPELPLPKGAIVGGKVYLRARVDRFN